MKKLFMFLASAAFITQAHAMHDDDSFSQSRRHITKDAFFTVDNQSGTPLSVTAVATGVDGFPCAAPICATFSLDVEPGETSSYKQSSFKREYFEAGRCVLDKIGMITIYLKGTSTSIEMGPDHYFRNGGTFTVTDELLQK
jgi:hypothetical protein